MLETGPYIIVQELSSNIGKSVQRAFHKSQLTILYNAMSITLNTYCMFNLECSLEKLSEKCLLKTMRQLYNTRNFYSLNNYCLQVVAVIIVKKNHKSHRALDYCKLQAGLPCIN